MAVKQFGIQALCEQVCRIVGPTPVFEFQQSITHLFSQPVQTNLDMTWPSWDIHGLHKLQCGARVTLKPYNPAHQSNAMQTSLWTISQTQHSPDTLIEDHTAQLHMSSNLTLVVAGSETLYQRPLKEDCSIDFSIIKSVQRMRSVAKGLKMYRPQLSAINLTHDGFIPARQTQTSMHVIVQKVQDRSQSLFRSMH